VDAIVQKRSGDWAAFEVKLGMGRVDEAASCLLVLPERVPQAEREPAVPVVVVIVREVERGLPVE